LKQADVTPKQCAKCRTRIWNSDGDGEKAAQMIIEKPSKVERARESAKPIEREVFIERASAIGREIESEEPPCKYQEYDQESGETYGCSLAAGHKEKCKRGRQL
jgi:hypothetical protein